MRFARISAVLGGILLAGAVTGPATAVDTDFTETLRANAGETSLIAPLGDLDKLRARGSQDAGEASPRTREAIGPILLIFLLRQNRFAGGVDILQPIVPR